MQYYRALSDRLSIINNIVKYLLILYKEYQIFDSQKTRWFVREYRKLILDGPNVDSIKYKFGILKNYLILIILFNRIKWKRTLILNLKGKYVILIYPYKQR